MERFCKEIYTTKNTFFLIIYKTMQKPPQIIELEK